ncbi:MAG: hypothetical protein AAGB11_19175 [Pseudomonadota bacterium]
MVTKSRIGWGSGLSLGRKGVGEAEFGGVDTLADRPSTLEAAKQHLAKLRRKLRRERTMGRRGHFAYDLARHLALTQMVKQAQALGQDNTPGCNGVGGAPEDMISNHGTREAPRKKDA